MSYCAPGGESSDGTCFSLSALRKIATAYNRNGGSRNKIKNIPSLTKRQLVDQITKRLSGVCQNEWCWIDQDFVKRLNDAEISYLTFRPERPEGKYQWLSTKDIFQVMRQYQRQYRDFRFFGPVPIDFDVVHQELATLKLGQLYKKGIRQIGVVYNLDPHDKPGSHWVSLFINLNKKEISFFDSYGVKPPRQIKAFMDRMAASYQEVGNPRKQFAINVNTYRHQHANSECGVYSMYFILQSLRGRSFHQIVSNTVADEEMNLCRMHYFRPSK